MTFASSLDEERVKESEAKWAAEAEERIDAVDRGELPTVDGPSALTELKEAILYYEQREIGPGAVFANEIETTLNRVLQSPNAWHQLSSRTKR